MIAKRIRKFLAIVIALALSAPVPVKAEELTLAQEMSSAVVLMQEVMQASYDNTIDEIKTLIQHNGYDYELTMDSFMDEGNPFKNMDYVDFIATYISIKDYCATEGLKFVPNIMDLPYITYTYEEDQIEENIPYKIDVYEEADDGMYKKTGYRYSTEEEEVGLYECVNKAEDLYRKKGTETVTPEKATTPFALIRLNVIDANALFDIAGIDKELLEEDIASRKDKINRETTNDELKSTIFIKMPEISFDNAFWQKTLQDELNKIAISRISMNSLSGDAMTDNSSMLSAVAASLIGQVPYEWGGKPQKTGYDTTWWSYNPKSGDQHGLDCSGFVKWVYMTSGYGEDITAHLNSTYDMLRAGFMRVSANDLKPGDIGVVEHKHSNHCGIYAGNDEWYHCSSYSDTVVKAPYHFTSYFRPYATAELKEPDIFMVYYTSQPVNNDDALLLAQLIAHEAGSEGLNGWIAVGEIVRNRVKSPLFPNSVGEVIDQKGQFTGVAAIRSINPRPEILNTAREVLSGRLSILNNENVLYFRNPTTTSGISPAARINWGKHVYYTYIGHHAFYMQ